jgi:L-alanine-DL-glutamate epimerase-like enolase superfamily enzyme
VSRRSCYTAHNRIPEPELRPVAGHAKQEAIGDDVDLLIDCHWKYNVSDAIRLARELEPFKLLWLEDPVPPENVAAHRLVTQARATPICTGENLYLKHGFRELISTHACDVVAPDVPKMGGLSEAK